MPTFWRNFKSILSLRRISKIIFYKNCMKIKKELKKKKKFRGDFEYKARSCREDFKKTSCGKLWRNFSTISENFFVI